MYYRVLCPLVPAVLGHTGSKTAEVDQREGGGQQSKVDGVRV